MLLAMLRSVSRIPRDVVKRLFLGRKIIVSVFSEGKHFLDCLKSLDGKKDIEVNPLILKIDRNVSRSSSGQFYRFLIIKNSVFCEMLGKEKIDLSEIESVATSMGLQKPNIESACLLFERFTRVSYLPDIITVFVPPIKIGQSYPGSILCFSRDDGVTRIDPVVLSNAMWDDSEYLAFILPYNLPSTEPILEGKRQMVHEKPVLAT